MQKDKCLIIHHGALGDVVVTFPALIELKKNCRRIEILCRNEIGRLARMLHVVDKWHSLESAAFSTLFSNHVDTHAKDVLLSFSEIILFSRSLQLQKTLSTITGKSVYRISPRPDVHQRIHVTEHLGSNLSKLGLLEAPLAYFRNSSSPIHRDRRDPQYERAKILIHPGSGSRKKCWPLLNFIQIAFSLDEKGFQPEFILGPAEHDFTQILFKQKGFNEKIHVMDHLESVARKLKTGGAFIGNDSGITHLAAFLGLPTIAVFGPSDPVRWGPVGRSVKIIRPKLDCKSCFETKNSKCEDVKCFNRTAIGDVLRAFYEILPSNQHECRVS